MTSRGTKYWTSAAIPLIAPDILGDIIASASDISVVISDLGHVLSVLVNPNHASFGQLDDWIRRDIREVLTTESVPKFEARLAEFVNGAATVRPVELNHPGIAAMGFPIRYSFHRIGADGAILMLGRDLRPIAEMQQQLVEAQMALECDYETQREVATRLSVLMETSDDAVVFVRLADGRIADLNAAAARLLGGAVADLAGTPFVERPGRDDDLVDRLAASARAENAVPTLFSARGSKKQIRAEATLFRAAGQRMMLCRLAPAQPAEATSDDASLLPAVFFEKAVDAMVFTDRSGRILSVNDAFLSLLDLDDTSVARSRNLADFLLRGSVDLTVLVENAVRTGQMKFFATRMLSGFGAEQAVEVSATYLAHDTAPAIGFVIRDAGRLDAVRPATATVGDDGMRSARELVGAATLKEIVSETSDVVEKMCIETAVELTGNNRVAAAEMLGLSRQSLYVKLRKYDLLARKPA